MAKDNGKPTSMSPMLLLSTTALQEREDCEIKLDGYSIIAFKNRRQGAAAAQRQEAKPYRPRYCLASTAAAAFSAVMAA